MTRRIELLPPFMAFLCGRGVAAAAFLADAAELLDAAQRARQMALVAAGEVFMRRTAEGGDGGALSLAAFQVGEGGGLLFASGWWRGRGEVARAEGARLRGEELLRKAALLEHAGLRARIDALRRLGRRLAEGDAAALAELDAALSDPQLQAVLAAGVPPAPADAAEAELYARIVRHPDDQGYTVPRDNELRAELGRRIAARDPAHGELVRLQLELNVYRRSPQVLPEIAALLARETQLLARHAARWSPVVRGVESFGFRRGLVGQMTLPAHVFLAGAATLYRIAPITEVTLHGGARELAAQLFASPALARLRGLSLRGEEIGDEGLARLAASPHAGNLVHLDLDGNGVTPRGLRALATSPALRSLQLVQLEGAASHPRDVDPATGQVLAWQLPDSGRALEDELGWIRWLHAERWPPHADVDAVMAISLPT